mgnify:CR=1 FL=1
MLGAIRDASEAAVSNCAVTLEGVDTGVTARTITDAAGNYQFFNVKIGRCQVTAEHPGFKKAVSDPFTVSVSARQRVNLKLEVGEVTERVTVTEAAALLETDSSSRGTVIGRQQAVDLPLNGRAYADLTLLTPGATQALKGPLSGRDASYHVNGLRSSFNNFMLDGAENNAYGASNQGFSNQVVQLSPDAVGEFKVTTNNYSAEYGRAGGAVISASLRSGTNDLRLSVLGVPAQHEPQRGGLFQAALRQADAGSEPVRRRRRRARHQEQDLLVRRLRGLPPHPEAARLRECSQHGIAPGHRQPAPGGSLQRRAGLRRARAGQPDHSVRG